MMSNLDQRAPILDVWTSYPMALVFGRTVGDFEHGDINTTLAGYSWSCVPTDQVTSLDPSLMYGRNLYAQLLARAQVWCNADAPSRAVKCQIVKDFDGRGRPRLWLGIVPTAGAGALTAFYASAVQIAVSSADGSARNEPATMRRLGFNDRLPISYGVDEAIEVARFGPPSTWADDDPPNAVIEEPNAVWALCRWPVGTWAPCHMGWTLRDRRITERRVTVSPYDGRSAIVMHWGDRRETELVLEMVHAAEIMRERLGNVPCDGWAEAAGRERYEGRTLDDLIPWLSRSTPQKRIVAALNESGWAFDGTDGRVGLDTPSRAWAPDWGAPAIIHLTTQARYGYEMVGRPDLLSNTSYSASPAIITSDSSIARHVILDDGLPDTLAYSEAQLGQRRFRVTIPLVDVTPEAVRRRADVGQALYALDTPTIYNDN